MLFGSDQFYQCPKCNNILYNGSLISGNNMGAKLYSDGKQIAPMQIEFPVISKCSKCNTIFWLENEIEILKHVDSEEVEFLSISDYQTALKNKLFRSKEEEIYLRKGIIWGFNDRIRNGKPELKPDSNSEILEGITNNLIDVDNKRIKNAGSLFNSAIEKEVWIENIQKMIDVLGHKGVDAQICLVELYRYLGDFQKCNTLLESINHPQYDWWKKILKNHLEDKNKRVILLKYIN